MDKNGQKFDKMDKISTKKRKWKKIDLIGQKIDIVRYTKLT